MDVFHIKPNTVSFLLCRFFTPSSITRSVDDLQLEVGSEVVALVKSTEVSIAKL